MNQARRVLIADDHPLTREGLALAARAAVPGGSIDQTGTIEESERAIVARTGGYVLVLLDLVLPDTRGFSGFLRLQPLLRETPIVIVSAREEATAIEAARALGASGYLSKSRPIDEIARRLKAIVAGGTDFPSALATSEAGSIEAARDRIGNLSSAQLKVLLALADGRLNKQIAHELDITEATVKAHLSAIFRKLGVNNRTQALLAVQPLIGDAAEMMSA